MGDGKDNHARNWEDMEDNKREDKEKMSCNHMVFLVMANEQILSHGSDKILK